MSSLSKPFLVTWAVITLSVAAPVSAGSEGDAPLGDATIGETLYKENCRRCHGPTAKGLASYPTLRGHPVEYLTDRLERYRAGEKFGPNTPLMAPQAKPLSDEDIANVSTFIVSLK